MAARPGPSYALDHGAFMPRLFLAALALTAGCASVSPTVRTNGFGPNDPTRDRAAARDGAGGSVEVIIGALPPGLAAEGENIRVLPGYERTYRVVGRVEADLTRQIASAPTRNWLTSWNYDQGWRKGLCWPQVPLKIVTLGLWTAVPTHYPCVTVLPAGEARRQELLVEHLRRGTAAIGGDLVVTTGVGAMQQRRVDSWGYAYPGRFRNMTSVRGVAVQVLGPPPAAPPRSARPPPRGPGTPSALPGSAPPPREPTTQPPRTAPRRPPPRR
jgi:hypothetical protein